MVPSPDLGFQGPIQAPPVRPSPGLQAGDGGDGRWDGELTANERLRREAPKQLNRALVLAAALHGALFLFSPDWTRSVSDSSWGPMAQGFQVVALGGGDADVGVDAGSGFLDQGPWGTGSWVVAPAEDGLSEADPALDGMPGAEEGGPSRHDGPSGATDGVFGVSSGANASGADALARLGALRPQLQVPVAPRETPSTSSERELADREGEDGAAATGGDGGDGDARDRRLRSELAERLDDRLAREEILDLERLSALRPELALTSPSNWILLRNPVEVGQFLERHFGGSMASGPPRGLLSVALWIDERGSVEWAEINRSSGDPELDRSALELFERVVSFSPARENGFRVPVAVIFWLSFW